MECFTAVVRIVLLRIRALRSTSPVSSLPRPAGLPASAPRQPRHPYRTELTAWGEGEAEQLTPLCRVYLQDPFPPAVALGSAAERRSDADGAKKRPPLPELDAVPTPRGLLACASR